jgi:hypothetical protein
MTLKDHCNALSQARQFALAIRLCKLGLPIWERYAEKHALRYTDSVVALRHKVDKNLLADTLSDIETYISNCRPDANCIDNSLLSKRREQFSDPVVALQDDDWKLPYSVERIFYAVYNLLEAAYGSEPDESGEPTVYLSINQAIDGLETGSVLSITEIKNLLVEFEK